ncbi:MAG: hypothetical protein R3F61_04310 [Myxococcota bacterium]
MFVLASLAFAAPIPDDLPRLESDELTLKDNAGGPFWPSDTSGPTLCRVRAVVETSGKVSTTDVTGCGPGFAHEAGNWVRQWRYEPPLRDGAPIRGYTIADVRFDQHYAQRKQTAGEHAVIEPRRSEGESCIIRATAHPDGTVDGLATNDPTHCRILETHPVPSKVWKRVDQRAECTVRFRVRQGFLDRAEVAECPEALMKPTVRLAESWELTEDEKGTDYELTAIYQPAE